MGTSLDEEPNVLLRAERVLSQTLLMMLRDLDPQNFEKRLMELRMHFLAPHQTDPILSRELLKRLQSHARILRESP